MRTAIVAMLCVGFAFGNLARADLDKGDYAPDIEAKEWMNTDEPISIIELRGMVVIVFFWVSWSPGGEEVMPLMSLLNSKFGRSRGVFLLAVTDSDRKRVEEMLKKQIAQFPVGLEAQQAFEDYDLVDLDRPRVVIIDANGKVAWTGWPGQKGGETLAKAVFDVIADTPPTKTHPEEAALARAALQQARQALRDDDYREAFKAARRANEHALTGDPLKTRCQDMLDLIEALGRDKLARADRAADEKDFEQAVTLLAEVRRDFKGVDVAVNARKKIEALKKKHEEVAAILEQQDDAALAENMLGSALNDINNRRFGKAYETLEEIVSEYAATGGATKAQTLLDRMRKNEGVMGYVRDHLASGECEMLLSQARAYLRAGRPERAKELLRTVMDNHSDTVYADEAAEVLAGIP